MKTIVCDNIYKIRVKKNLTQEFMADYLCISQSQYSKMERGTQKFSFEAILKIAEILGVEVKDFLDTECIN